MQCGWLGERVAAPNLRTVVKNALTKETAGNWGPNATFKFPTHGGTGGIWAALAKTLPSKKFRDGEAGKVESIDVKDKVVEMGDGRRLRYRNMISTLAVDHLLDRIEVSGESEKTDLNKMRTAAKEGLVYSSTIILGLGIRGVRPDRIGDKCESSRV